MKKHIKSNRFGFVWQQLTPAHRVLIIGFIIVASLAPVYIAVIACYSWFVEQWNQFASLFTPYL